MLMLVIISSGPLIGGGGVNSQSQDYLRVRVRF